MACYHVSIQSRVYSCITNATVTRSSITKRLVCPLRASRQRRSTSEARRRRVSEDCFRPLSAQRRDIRRRMWEWVLIYPVSMYQSAAGLVKEKGVHGDPSYVWSEGIVPDVPGYRPWGKNWATLVLISSVDPPCFSARCSRQARPDPFHTAHHVTGQRHS